MDRQLQSCLYVGHVMHRRLRPFGHRFRYRIFSFYLDLDELEILPRHLRFFSYNRWNLVSFRDRDHGPRDGRPLRPWIEAELTAAGIAGPFGAIRLLCFPRLLGYVFNPLSLWFCHAADGRLVAVLYEVSNTFGERHGYLIPIAWDTNGVIEQCCDKQLYVSPFMPMKAHYRFRLKAPDERLAVAILETVAEQPTLAATQMGRRRSLTSRSLTRVLLSHPLMTFKVIGAIHWQALRLWLKGARPVPRPASPRVAVTRLPPRFISAAE